MTQTIVTNVAIYIKRAEIYQNENYIKDVFNRNGYGIVNSVNFVEKVSENKQKYHGVLVTMKYWFKNPSVSKILESISIDNNEIKIYHSKTKYWIIKQYTQPVKENTPIIIEIDNNICGNERIKELELIVNSLSVQITQLQKIKDSNKITIEKYEKKEIFNELIIEELKSQNEYDNKLIQDIENENNSLQYENSLMYNKNIQLHHTIEDLIDRSENEKLSALDQEKTFHLIEREVNDMRNMLNYYETKESSDKEYIV